MSDVFIMPANRSSRVVNTEELLELNERAIAFGKSRVLDPYAFLEIDPDGVHILTPVRIMFLPFERCEVALKLAGKKKPAHAWLDLEIEWLDELTTLADYLRALKVRDQQMLSDLRQQVIGQENARE